jgi:hypothetical protein
MNIAATGFFDSERRFMPPSVVLPMPCVETPLLQWSANQALWEGKSWWLEMKEGLSGLKYLAAGEEVKRP